VVPTSVLCPAGAHVCVVALNPVYPNLFHYLPPPDTHTHMPLTQCHIDRFVIFFMCTTIDVLCVPFGYGVCARGRDRLRVPCWVIRRHRIHLSPWPVFHRWQQRVHHV
jgi:hypothetical protein